MGCTVVVGGQYGSEGKGKVTALGYAYLRNPALQYAKELVEAGAIGEVFDFRGSVDEDYMADPTLPWSWRLTAKDAGLGSLGDLTCHLVSLAQELVGDIGSLCAMADVVHGCSQIFFRIDQRTVEIEDENRAHRVIIAS